MTDARRFLHDEEPLEFKKGGVLRPLIMADETWGELNAELHSSQ